MRGYFRSQSKPLSYRTTTIFPSLYFLVTDSFSTCPIRKPPAASQFLPNHHLFLMDYVDTMSPGQCPPSPAEPAAPGAKPGTPSMPSACQWKDSWGWEGCGRQVTGSPRMGQKVAGWGGEGVGVGRQSGQELRGPQKTCRGRQT